MISIELITIGSELLQGWRMNTHAQWLCQQLGGRGYVVTRQLAIDDDASTISRAIGEALGRAGLVITTGGLGPTSDDRTREAVAELLGRSLREDPEVLAQIEDYFAQRQRPLSLISRRQALLPEGAWALPNRFGTAPGLVMDAGATQPERAGRTLIMLPGPPRELRPMFCDQVVPLLERRFPPAVEFASVILKTVGLGESLVEERITGPLSGQTASGLELAFCARPGEVDVRLGMRGPGAEARVAEAEKIVRERLGHLVFGTGERELEQVLIELLRDRGRTLAVAESCTGGLLAHRLTNVPGASAVFLAGLVTYSNGAKEQLLGVRPETLAAFGAVSEETVREMVEAVRGRMGSDYGLAVTGIAGPTGGSAEKPVGTVYVAMAGPGGTQVRRYLNRFERETFKYTTCQQAMDLLRQDLL